MANSQTEMRNVPKEMPTLVNEMRNILAKCGDRLKKSSERPKKCNDRVERYGKGHKKRGFRVVGKGIPNENGSLVTLIFTLKLLL